MKICLSILLALGCFYHSPAQASFKILHYTETSGFDHNTRNESLDMFQDLGGEHGFTVDDDQTGVSFNSLANLQQYAVVVFSSTSGDAILNATQQANFEAYMNAGGSYLGIHAASDTYRHGSANGTNTGTWDWYAEMMGGSVQNNPNHTSNSYAGIMDTIGNHPSTARVPDPWAKNEEYYYWESGFLSSQIREVLRVRSTGSDSYDNPRPMSWYRHLAGGGRVFYTALGHFSANFDTTTTFSQHIEDALLWTAGICTSKGAYQYNNGWSQNPSGLAHSCDSIVIQAGNATITGNNEARVLIVHPNTTLDLGGDTLLVTDTAFIQADATGYGQVLGRIEGNVVWQTHISSTDPRWYNNAFPAVASVNDISGALINLSGDPATHNIYNYNAQLDSNNEGKWVLSSGSDNLGTKAHQIFLSPSFGGSSATLSVFGELLDGNIDIPIYKNVGGNNSAGWNYIPNPYPSIMNFDSLVNQNPTKITDTYYISDGDPNATSYHSYNSTMGTGANGGVATIAPGQAFFVQAQLDGITNVEFRNTQRHLGTTPLLKVNSGNVDFLKLSVGDSSRQMSDQVVIGFDASFTVGLDQSGADAEKMMNYNFPNVYTQIANDPYVFNGVNNQFSTHSEGLYFESTYDGTYEVSIAENSLPAQWTVSLEDKFTSVTTNLLSGTYTFHHLSSNAADRFVVHINQGTVSVDEEDKASGIYAYHTGERVMVNIEQYEGQATIMLYDMSGKLLLQQKQVDGGESLTINTDIMPSGIYLLKVLSVNGQVLHSQKLAW